jgi:hypothetical protein
VHEDSELMADVTAPCVSCGKPKNPDAAYCVHCGAAQVNPAPSGHTPPPADPLRTFATPNFVLNEHPASLTQRGFLASLFDTSFTSLVGTKLVRVLYLLAMIWVGLIALFYILFAFHISPTLGLLVLLVVAPISSLFMLGFTRIVLELCIGLFQVMANSNELVAQGRRKESHQVDGH